MKLVKLAIISAIIFFGLLMILSSLIPSSVRISRAIDMNKNPADIKQYLQDLRNWKQWNAMVHDTVLLNPRYSINKIEAENFLITVDSINPSLIATSWERGDKRVTSNLQLIQSSEQLTIVQWYFDIRLKWYPWEKFSSIVFDKQMGPLMERSLDSLKNQVENLH